MAGPGAARRFVAAGAIALALTACATLESPVSMPNARTTEPGASTVATPPEWRPGDQWTFRWTAGAQSGTRTAEVVEVRPLGGQSYYLLRIGTVDHLYTRDLHVAGTLKNETVESRLVPPVPLLTWPLEPGRRWEHRGTYEGREGKREVSDVFTVVGPEIVETPAGRFNALKVVRQGSAGDSDEYWFAPQVHYYVKWVGRRANTEVEEQLQSYRLAGEPGVPSAPAAPPSGPSGPVPPPSPPSGSPSSPR